ncbi:MAG TPA: DUF4398 domain-containing protein, partial [Polyangiaceae bacterium LLY-WYZ-15_(1-7)]|nr:DUF4398 domain-containing protein [Polyangiaceae bacterium LLY-WYZ-15_(1-7)]
MRALLVFALLLLAPLGAAQEATPGLEARLRAAEEAPEAREAAGPLRQAREALARAEALEGPAARRARGIADAALTLAERRIARARARAALAQAQRQAEAATRRAAVAREALERARRRASGQGAGSGAGSGAG